MLRRVISTLAILVMLPSAASARSTYCGTHMGFAQGPDQMVVGGQLQFNGIAPRMAFVPGIDYGFGPRSNSVVAVNADFHLNLTYDTTWQPYLGAGVSTNVWSEADRAGNRQDVLQPGGQLIVGAATYNRGGRFFTELKLGFRDSPEMKMLAGWNLRSR